MKKPVIWVKLGNGLLSIGGRPSLQKVEKLKAQKCTVLVSLLRQSEEHIAKAIGERVQSLGIEWIWFPLSASDLPANEYLVKAKQLFDVLRIHLDQGANIFIHCAAGIHRTAAFTFGLLRFLGNTANESRQIIEQLRPITAIHAQPTHWEWGEQFGKEYDYLNFLEMKNECVFCKIIQGELPASVVYEDDDVLAIMDIQPINAGHVLVMPRQCYEKLNQMPTALGQKLMATVMAIEKALWTVEGLNCEGTNILQNNGKSAGQDVFHVHFHIIPRFSGDKFKLKFSTHRPTREALNEVAEQIKESK